MYNFKNIFFSLTTVCACKNCSLQGSFPLPVLRSDKMWTFPRINRWPGFPLTLDLDHPRCSNSRGLQTLQIIRNTKLQVLTQCELCLFSVWWLLFFFQENLKAQGVFEKILKSGNNLIVTRLSLHVSLSEMIVAPTIVNNGAVNHSKQQVVNLSTGSQPVVNQ